MQHNYDNMQLIYVNMWDNYVDMQDIYVDIIFLHVDIIFLHVNIMYLACKGRNFIFYLLNSVNHSIECSHPVGILIKCISLCRNARFFLEVRALSRSLTPLATPQMFVLSVGFTYCKRIRNLPLLYSSRWSLQQTVLLDKHVPSFSLNVDSMIFR
jgi:hypothetical protein